MKLLSGLLILGIVIMLAWFYLSGAKDATNSGPLQALQTVTGQKIEVTKTDITQNGVSKLPVGFPPSIPMEAANITESYRTVYKEQGATQYSVSYTSLKGKDTLWDLYSKYLADAGYTVDKNASSKAMGQILGQKGSSSLSVIVSAH